MEDPSACGKQNICYEKVEKLNQVLLSQMCLKVSKENVLNVVGSAPRKFQETVWENANLVHSRAGSLSPWANENTLGVSLLYWSH